MLVPICSDTLFFAYGGSRKPAAANPNHGCQDLQPRNIISVDSGRSKTWYQGVSSAEREPSIAAGSIQISVQARMVFVKRTWGTACFFPLGPSASAFSAGSRLQDFSPTATQRDPDRVKAGGVAWGIWLRGSGRALPSASQHSDAMPERPPPVS